MATSTNACDPPTSKCQVEQVLSDIPFISVGILVLGVSVLFVVMKRVTLSAVLLLLSVLLAFVASVLDLSQTLASEGLTSGPAAQAREALFALSIGLRFLFYWSYVAEPSRKDLSAAFYFPLFESTHEPHSGSWMRWGFLGKSVATGLLLAILTVTSLQIIWRLVPQFRQYSNVYAADAALELLVSFLLLLKLLSNTIALGSADSILVHTLSEHLGAISGLLFNIAIGVGDLLRFAFTESTVGRLLQALEVYIIVAFAVVTTFLRHRDILLSATLSQDTRHRNGVFRLPEPACGSAFRISPPLIETPRMSTIIGIATPNKELSKQTLHRSARRSLNHVSSWLSFRIQKRRSCYDDEEVKLWNGEKGQIDPPYTDGMDDLRAFVETSTRASNDLLEHVCETSAVDAPSATARFTKVSSHDGQIPEISRTNAPQRTTPHQVYTSPIPSSPASPMISGMRRTGSEAMVPDVSPIYGLSGVQSTANTYHSRASLNELLRRQSQLDRSMEALKSFSVETSASPSPSNAAPNHRSVQLTRSPSNGQKTICSEVSLSNFPIPPWQTTPIPSLPPSSSSPIQRIRGDRRVLLAAARVQDNYALGPPGALTSHSARFDSIPHTPTGEENESLSTEARMSSRSGLGGMEYNVTSFIGDLATPGESDQGSQQKTWWPVENESNLGTGSVMKQLPTVPPEAKLPPLGCSSRLSQAEVVYEHANVADRTSCSRAFLKASRLSVTDGEKMDRFARSPTRSQQLVREADSTEVDGRIQRMFVRRRPARLAIQPYNPGTPLVQVVEDNY